MAPGIYRVEISPNNRAGCRGSECKNAGIKIFTGQMRFGTFVQILDFQNFHWKHWGCVTPKQIGSLKDAIEDNLDNLDGYEDLPEHEQEKVRKAVADGHVDDEDWIGDKEMNRPGMNGYRKTQKMLQNEAKAAAKEAAAKEEAEAGSSKAPSKKRRRIKDDPDAENDEEEVPAPKKSRAGSKKGKKAKGGDMDDASEDEVMPIKKDRKPSKKAKADGDAAIAIKEESSDRDAVPESPKKKPRAPRKKVKTDANSDAAMAIKEEDNNHDARPQLPQKKGRAPRKAAAPKKINYEEDDSDALSDEPQAEVEKMQKKAETEEESDLGVEADEEASKPKNARKAAVTKNTANGTNRSAEPKEKAKAQQQKTASDGALKPQRTNGRVTRSHPKA